MSQYETTRRFCGQTEVEHARMISDGRPIAPRVNDPSPWGTVQTARELAPGIVTVTTASHGGVWLSPDRERSIPDQVRAIARQYAPANWYEEDCDVAIVALWFAPDLIAADPLQVEFIDYSRRYVAADNRMKPLRDAMIARAQNGGRL